ncbi:MAG TPA: CpsB/CapC family capsule biosynthesis tyrosine phosphatase [Nannocystaceae bacterium]|nr:CpsB/CapC family capsule biosynthesis tyrosine phosphatase [Nannocystaceae bacterium]
MDVFGWFKRRDNTASGLALRPRDCHCHAIPGVDDGSRDMEMSLAMLRLLQAAGARTIVCTSHMYPGKYDNTPDILRRAFEPLERARDDARIAVKLELGAEHFLDDRLPERILAGEVLPFGPERYVLFETPTGEHVPPALWQSVHAITSRGFVPLLAHVERYHWLRGEDGDDVCEDLRAAGVRFQCNRTVGKVNVPGEGHRGRFIAKLIARGWVDEVGSDLHRATDEGRPF